MPCNKATAAAVLLIFVIVFIAGCVQDKTGITTAQTNNISAVIPGFENITSVDQSNYNDSYGLTASQKMDAISIAVNNDSVRQSLDSYQGYSNRTIKAVTFMNASNMGGYYWAFFNEGLINQPDLVVTVPIQIGEMAPGVDYYNIFVDLSSRRIIGTEEYSFRALPAYENVQLPPGSAWYHQLSGAKKVIPGNYTAISFLIVVNISDVSALYPVVFTEDELQGFKNDSVYSPFTWRDAITNETQTIDGKSAIGPQHEDNGTAEWRITMRISCDLSMDEKYFNPRYYYLAIENKANRSVPVEFMLLLAN